MTNITWHQMNRLDELTYEVLALLEVTGDGLLNETCPSNPENSGAVIRMVIDRVDEIGKIHEEMWKQQREARADDGRTDEDADEGEDFDTKDLFSRDELWEDWEETEVEPASRFDVKEIMRHEDGSATYQISGSDEEMRKLFEVFFTHAVINGIKYTQEDNDEEVYRMQVVTAARELEVLLREWETSDDLDYSPTVENKRLKLKELLDKAGV
jgi:hypothetical protein